MGSQLSRQAIGKYIDIGQDGRIPQLPSLRLAMATSSIKPAILQLSRQPGDLRQLGRQAAGRLAAFDDGTWLDC